MNNQSTKYHIRYFTDCFGNPSPIVYWCGEDINSTHKQLGDIQEEYPKCQGIVEECKCGRKL